ncbi:type III pantothenate kinase [Aestuariibaculum suncheonense]|uniref:Type III pantothenate kinase n=1 Tax=Aestuariibaculum suncheonense TaxID=1028745 RepID=A0A8J6QGW4_9FLAO|nr:type III pantothenate kinase [Aestuariibaculum suncheonense]MBD0836300.1 type III pantothenate kinase [Aestuariibaculum suncheonense]
MNLVIDVGNTLVKLAVFSENKLIEKQTVELSNIIEAIKGLKAVYKSIKQAIVSSVGKLDDKTLEEIKNLFSLFVVDANTRLPFINKYQTPKTLGVDRIGLVCAAVNQFPKTNTLIIDAGTCITYDFVTSSEEYLGGAISPGLRMRYKALNNLTAKLPLLDTEMPESIIGDSTITSIHSGVVYGVLKEMEGIILNYQEKYSDLTVILTGGDCNFLSKQLKSTIFVNLNFLLEGLNQILQFNSNE